MSEVHVKENESLDSALKRFKRSCAKAGVLAEVRRQIGARLTTGEAVYYDDWLSLVSRRFSPDRFYLTGNGPVLFYPPETIAPPLEGFPTFPLSALLASQEEKPGEGAEIPKEVAVS